MREAASIMIDARRASIGYLDMTYAAIPLITRCRAYGAYIRSREAPSGISSAADAIIAVTKPV